ncbi:MAG: hypothetical protein R3C08_05335 [Hyphomonas sp.]
MKLNAMVALTAMSGAMAALPANAEYDSHVWLRLQPGDSQTFYVTGQEGAASLPVFRVCSSSPLGYKGSIRMTQADKGVAHGAIERMAPGTCLFVSGEKLVASVDLDRPAGTQETPKTDASELAEQPSVFQVFIVNK